MKEFLKILAVAAIGIIAGYSLHNCNTLDVASGRTGRASLPIDTVTYVDTIPYLLPTPAKETGLGTRIVYVPVFSPKDKASDAEGDGGDAPCGAAVRMTALHDSEQDGAAAGMATLHDAERDGGDAPCGAAVRMTALQDPAVRMTALHDSVAVEIPITQREYEGEEYHAWVSGYDPKLDSIFVFPRREVVTIRNPPDRAKRWGLGPSVGLGLTPQGIQPYIGVSLTYNILQF